MVKDLNRLSGQFNGTSSTPVLRKMETARFEVEASRFI